MIYAITVIISFACFTQMVHKLYGLFSCMGMACFIPYLMISFIPWANLILSIGCLIGVYVDTRENVN